MGKATPTGSTAAPLTPTEAHEATTPPQSRTVAAGLEYLARLEADNIALKDALDRLLKAGKLAELEVDSLTSRLAAAESRVAELQIRSDEAVRKEAGLKATLEAVIRTALFGADPAQTIESLRKRLADHEKLHARANARQ